MLSDEQLHPSMILYLQNIEVFRSRSQLILTTVVLYINCFAEKWTRIYGNGWI